MKNSKAKIGLVSISDRASSGTYQDKGIPSLKKWLAKALLYDYEVVEKWVTGVWRAKTPLTRKYAVHMQEAGKKIQISFCKVAAHTGNHYNEEADQLAKSALLRTDEEVKIV